MRTFTLSLEVFEYAIAFHCNYLPRVKGGGGYFGLVYPDGGLYGMPFDELKSLGNGTHEVELDERRHTPHGTEPEFDDARERFEIYRHVLFGYPLGVFTRTEVLMRALLAYTEEYADDIRCLAPDFLLASLREFASHIPDDLDERSPDDYDFVCSAGTTRIPDANLELLRKTADKLVRQ